MNCPWRFLVYIPPGPFFLVGFSTAVRLGEAKKETGVVAVARWVASAYRMIGNVGAELEAWRDVNKETPEKGQVIFNFRT